MITVEQVEVEEVRVPKFDELRPGTVFEFDDAVNEKDRTLALKLHNGECVLLAIDSKTDWFKVSNSSMVKHYRIAKVHGKLVGVKVQP